jgi:hypothetical protein
MKIKRSRFISWLSAITTLCLVVTSVSLGFKSANATPTQPLCPATGTSCPTPTNPLTNECYIVVENYGGFTEYSFCEDCDADGVAHCITELVNHMVWKQFCTPPDEPGDPYPSDDPPQNWPNICAEVNVYYGGACTTDMQCGGGGV